MDKSVYVIFMFAFGNILILLTMANTTKNDNRNDLEIIAWNMGCRLNSSIVYLHQQIFKADIVCLSEHGLYGCEINKLDSIHPEFKCLAKPSRHLKDINFGHRAGHGGCAILWNRGLSNRIKPLPDIGTDRICAIQLNENGQRYYIISVYLPHQNCKIDDFENELNELRKVCEMCLTDGSVIIMGDVNSHFSSFYGPRCSGKTTTNGKKFACTMNKCNLEILDISSAGRGPCYTWHSEDGKLQSYIDHVMVSQSMRPLVKYCEVIEDCITNVSDHLPLILGLKLPCKGIVNPVNRYQVAWQKVDNDTVNSLYTIPLEKDIQSILSSLCTTASDVNDTAELSEVTNSLHDQNTVEMMLNKICGSVLWHSSHLPMVNYNKRLKPYWNKELTALSKCEKRAKRVWVESGGFKIPENEYYKNYKECKRQFRREQRRQMFLYEKENMEKFAESGDVDQTFFWHMVNKKKKRAATVTPVKSDSGELLIDPSEILHEWQNYYTCLYKDVNNPNWDDDFKKEIDSKIMEIENIEGGPIKGGPITTDELDKQIRSLKNRKSGGWDHIVAEHIKYAGPTMKVALTLIMNAIIELEKVPMYCKRGLIVPIPKPGKDCSNKDKL